MLLGAEQVRVAQVTGADLREDFAARGHCLRLERLRVRGGEDLARHDALHQPLHRDRRDEREKPARIHGRVHPPGIRALLESMERVPHPELDLGHREALRSAQLERGFTGGADGSRHVDQLDPARRAQGELAKELRMNGRKAGGDVLRLRSCAGLGGVAVGEQRMAARVDHVPRDSIHLPHRGGPRRYSAGGPLRARPLQSRRVGKAQLLEQYPGGAHACAAGGEPHRPGSLGALEQQIGSGAVRRARPDGERTASGDGHLAAAFGNADRDEGLAFFEGKAAGVEELERVVRGRGSGEQIGRRLRGLSRLCVGGIGPGRRWRGRSRIGSRGLGRLAAHRPRAPRERAGQPAEEAPAARHRRWVRST